VPEFFHNRALAYRALGRFEEARRDSDRAGKLRHAR
jgi:Flp pilus assembly protein TadD